MPSAQTLRKNTKNDLLNKLNIFGKCALVRCTGFGKTYLISELTSKYKSVLYLYPAAVIRDTAVAVVEKISEKKYKEQLSATGFDYRNIDFMTYYKFARLTKDEIQTLSQYDLIIMDECHRLGAPKTKENILRLMNINTHAHYIGATATPDRSDAEDVVEHFFGGICVYEYTLHDAFNDGIIKRPYYCYCTYDVEADLKIAALTAGQMQDDISLAIPPSKLIEISKLHNIPNIISDVCRQHAKDHEYMKFIIFFSSFSQLHDKQEEVCKWFQTAFPNFKVNSLVISSETKESQENVEKLDTLVKTDHTIDLILCIDMLNMGYHVDNLTGILMYRGTSSSIIYLQQLGRALSSGSDKPSIVFDIVDNIHRKAIYDLSPQNDRRPKEMLPLAKTIYLIDIADLTKEEKEELRQAYIEESNGKKWWRFCNNIIAKDLIATKHDATYRELLAKVVGEPLAQRAKRAQETHYKMWCRQNMLPYPATREQLENMQDVIPRLTSFAAQANVTVKQFLDAVYPEET